MTADQTRFALMAATLTAAQRRALCAIPIKREFLPKHTGFQWPTLAVLKQHRLINGVADGIEGLGPCAYHVVTPRGLSVREACEAMA